MALILYEYIYVSAYVFTYIDVKTHIQKVFVSIQTLTHIYMTTKKLKYFMEIRDIFPHSRHKKQNTDKAA